MLWLDSRLRATCFAPDDGSGENAVFDGSVDPLTVERRPEVYFAQMEFDWIPKKPDQLKRQADGLLKLAAKLRDPVRERRVRERAAALLAKAEEESPAGRH